jgi:hypothetical protein
MNARAILLNEKAVKEMEAERLSLEQRKTVSSCIRNLKICAKYKDGGGVNLQWDLQHDL